MIKTIEMKTGEAYVKPISPAAREQWAKALQDLDEFFGKAELPDPPIKLNKCTTITDVKKFVSSHLATVKANSFNNTFAPYVSRLLQLKKIIESNQIKKAA